MNYLETLNYIHSLGNFSMPSGLDRIKSVLTALGNPQEKLRAIHIAGTNGKGSVSVMLASVFKEAGYKTGLFTSPFIICFRERIQINGEYISEEELTEYAERVMATNIKLTEFEFITALSFLYFAEQKIDILICETGLGGRLDATNTLENKIASVITKIGLDHTQILGNTLEAIAKEKCGILRDCPTVTNPYQPKGALEVIKDSASSLFVPDLNQLEILKENAVGNSFIYMNDKYNLSLCGEFQIENALVAIETLKVCGINIPYTYMYRGMEKAFIPARMEMLSDEPLIMLDGAHNPDGAKALETELKKHSGSVTAVIGMMRDKNCGEFLKRTLKHCKSAIAVEVEGLPRSISAEELKIIASQYCDCEVAESYNSAIDKAKELANGGPVFIFGSLYLASEIRKILKK